ncbi:MAG: cupin domain-containing protein [Rhodospirillaceae bacterium]
MHRISIIALSLALSISLTVPKVSAQTVLGDDIYVVPDSSASSIAMAAWIDGDIVMSAMGENTSEAPLNAIRYSAKEANWPTARVRALTFDKSKGGVLHPITDETLLYVLEGSARVGVGDTTVALSAGDVVSFPSGTLTNHNVEMDAIIVTWTTPSLTGERTPTHVRWADVEEGGFGPIKLRRYSFPGNSVRAVKLAAGGSTNPNSAKTDSLIYVTAGPMTFFQNGQEFVVDRGDFIREIAGAMHHWNIQSDSGFVTTSGLPLDMGNIDPDKATDVPPR